MIYFNTEERGAWFHYTGGTGRLAGCGKTLLFSEIRNLYYAESKADYS
jgi:hypothetical protein